TIAPAGTLRRRASAFDRGDRPHARRSAARPFHRTAACGSGEGCARTQGAGAPVSQSPRLRAPDAVQDVRLPLAVPELRRLAGRSSFQATACVPPLRILDAA